jgi:hypothetical protein
MRQDLPQDQAPEGPPEPACNGSEPDQGGGPKTGVSVPVGKPSGRSSPDQGGTPPTGVAIPARSETR